MDKNEESDSEEEILVYAEFDRSLSIEQYRNINILGLENEKPIVQLDDAFFMGQYQNSMGTYMFFEEDPAPKCLDPLFDKLPEKCLKYVTKTRKYLPMEHAYVTPKAGSEQDNENRKESEEDVKPVNFTSIEEAVDAIGVYLTPETSAEPKVGEKS